jgi:glucokinase
MILAGDIGGTKTHLALFDEGLQLVAERTYASRDYAACDLILEKWLSEPLPRARIACFGVAGPVKRGHVQTTNLPWVLDARDLAGRLGLGCVRLINDLEANAHGIAALGRNDFALLNPGADGAEGNAALISAGTGLGEAGLYWDGAMHRPFACEGGHAGFSPRNDLEIELLRHLISRFGPVSWERVLSGPGLVNIHEFLRDTGRAEEPGWLARRLRDQDAAAAISQAALDGSSPLCAMALDLFVSLYGSEAGNLALKVMATGGVYIGGGVAPKIIDKIRGSDFLEAFCDKGPMKPLLSAMPVRVILNEKTALLGAARCALEAARS